MGKQKLEQIYYDIRDKLHNNFSDIRHSCVRHKLCGRLQKSLENKIAEVVDNAVFHVMVDIQDRFAFRNGRGVWRKKQRITERSPGLIMWAKPSF